MTLLLMLCAAGGGVVLGAIYRDTLRDLYDDARDLMRRLE